MHAFKALLDLAETLLGPQGCPWDRQQTFSSLCPFLLEEAHELMEAVDLNDDQGTLEELGDLFYILIFYCKIAEKQKRFTLEEVLKQVHTKLVRRHPHVFGEEKTEDVNKIWENWEKIKKVENKGKQRESLLDGIPKTLPSLSRAQKMITKLKSSSFSADKKTAHSEDEKIGKSLLELVMQAEKKGVHAESALREILNSLEAQFRLEEQPLPFKERKQ